MNIDQALEKNGIVLPVPPAKGGAYAPAREFGDRFYYLSGCGPVIAGGQIYSGKLGESVTIEEGRKAARCCVLNLLAVLKRELGDLGRVKGIVKTLVFVASANDFYDQPKVADGGTRLLEDLFGEEIGRSARSAIGVNVLPGNIPVEIELLVEVE